MNVAEIDLVKSYARARKYTGNNPKDALGSKKVALHLVPAALAIWVSKVFKLSAKKYGPYNWRDQPVKKSIYLDAIERHLLALKDGQDLAEDTGLPHMAHIGANAALWLDAVATGNLLNDMPWADGPAAKLITELEDSDTTP